LGAVKNISEKNAVIVSLWPELTIEAVHTTRRICKNTRLGLWLLLKS